jgi:hypothetical protein
VNEEKIDDKIIFINPRELIPHERVNLSHAAYILVKLILFRRFDAPLLIDSKTKTILDGHHRRYAANRLGLKSVPCYPIDYINDSRIQVYSRRSDVFIDKNEVIRVALSENIFPHKTTRHEYKMPEFQPFILSELWE